jgi:SAM-dependent methyltransferase
MDAEARERRRCSFGPVAETYERYRPGYPAEAVAWVAGPTPGRVVDLGAGTGKLTRALLAAGHEVIAVEPDAEMRAAFAAALPGVRLLAGAAEQIPIPDASVDVVTTGQAFHWFDLDRAFPEIARVLRPGGALGVLWNARDESVPWVAELGQVLAGEDGTGATVDDEPETFGPLFGPVEQAEFHHADELDVAGLVGLAATRSHTITLPETERDELLRNVEEVGRRAAAGSPAGRLSLPYVTTALRAARLR